MNRFRISLTAAVLSVTSLIQAAEPFGINLACGDFGSEFPGEYGIHYTYPTDADLVYWQQKGLMLVRLPFRWERMQHSLYGTLSTDDLARVKEFVRAAKDRGMKVLLDMHNYCRRIDGGKERIIGTEDLPYEAFGNFWRQMAQEMQEFDNIYGYGLMNEPQGLPEGITWLRIAQTAIDSIRMADTVTPIVVGGYHWSSSRRWQRLSDNLKNLDDPSKNLIFEAHCYFDYDGSGTYKFSYEEEEGSPQCGINAVKPFVEWLRKNNLRGLVGEYGIPDNDPRWEKTLDNFLRYLQKNGVNAIYWASGPWWGDDVMTIPTYRGGDEKPQVKIISKYKTTK